MIKKLYFILNKEQKLASLALGALLFIGVLLEMLGIGMLLPVLSIIATPDYTLPIKSIPIIRNISFSEDFDFTLFLMLSLLCLFFIKTIFLTFLAWRSSKFSAELEAEVSTRILMGYLNESYIFHTKRNKSELLRNLKVEVAQFVEFVRCVIELTIELGIAIGLLGALLFIAFSSTLIILALFVLPCVVMYFLLRNKLNNWGQVRQVYEEQIQRYALEGLGLVKEIKLGGIETYFKNLFCDSSYAKADIIKKQRAWIQIPRFYLELIAVVALTSFTLVMYLNGKSLILIIPTLGAFAFAAFRIMPSINRIMTAMNFIIYSRAVVELIYQELKSIDKRSESALSQNLAKLSFSNRIEFENINFAYPESKDRQLKDMSFSISKGESVGLIGKTGSGKTTVINVLLGLIKPDSGALLIDGINVDNHKKEWQKKIGYVPQQITLIDGSILKNIALGISDEKICMDQIGVSIKAAQLTDFINSLPEGLSTKIGENGVLLSGGQRQRIGLARALYIDPDILVFDEATSALDNNTEREVIDSISRLGGKKTIIMVAHRLSTLDNCNRIFELTSGRFINKSKHQRKEI